MKQKHIYKKIFKLLLKGAFSFSVSYSTYGSDKSSDSSSSSPSCKRAVKEASEAIKGAEKLNKEWLTLAKQLRKEKADPNRTHIPYFAEEMPKYLTAMRNELGIDGSFEGFLEVVLKQPTATGNAGNDLKNIRTFVLQLENYAEQMVQKKDTAYHKWWDPFIGLLMSIQEELSSLGNDNTYFIDPDYQPLKLITEDSMEQDLQLIYDHTTHKLRNLIAGNFGKTIEIPEFSDHIQTYQNAGYLQFHRNLVHLTKYMKMIIQNGNVTYSRWLQFHYLLASIKELDFDYYPLESVDQDFPIGEIFDSSILHKFPKEILIPTFIKVGAKTYQKASSMGIHIVDFNDESIVYYSFKDSFVAHVDRIEEAIAKKHTGF